MYTITQPAGQESGHHDISENHIFVTMYSLNFLSFSSAFPVGGTQV